MLQVKKSKPSLPRSPQPSSVFLTTRPRGITFDIQHQHILVSALNHHLIQFNRADLKELSLVGHGSEQLGRLREARGLCIQPFTRHLLVCDIHNNRVQVLSSSSSSSPGDYQLLCVIGSHGGQESDAKGEFDQPYGVCCAPDGSIVVADSHNHRIQQLDPSGRFVHTFGKRGSGPQELNFPFDVCHLNRRFAPSSSASSLLLVADFGNKRVAMWSADGRQAISQIDVGGDVYGVCVDLNGLVYVSVGIVFGDHVVRIYDPRRIAGDGALLQTLGFMVGGGHGHFNYPGGMCVDDTNTMMVADSWNNRVQLFE